MKQLRDTVWQRQGTSWIWDAEALSQVCVVSEVWSLRQLLQAVGHWPEDLPSNDNKTLVVAGLDGALDLLTPVDAEEWLDSAIKQAILSFQSYYEGEASLIFWLPSGKGRITTNSATDAISWCCAAPYTGNYLDFGRVLWGEAREYPKEIILRDGASSCGLFHLRIT